MANLPLHNLVNSTEYNQTLFQIEWNNREMFYDCTTKDKDVKKFLYPPILLSGAILNVLCVVIFSNKKFGKSCTKHATFKYLSLKSVFDALILFLKVRFVTSFVNQEDVTFSIFFLLKLLFQSFEFMYECEPQENPSNSSQINSTQYPLIQDMTYEHCIHQQQNFLYFFKIFTMEYFIYVCTMCSIVFELGAQIDRLIAISFTTNFWSRYRFIPSYKVASISTVLISAIGYTYKLYFKLKTTDHRSTYNDNMGYNNSVAETNSSGTLSMITLQNIHMAHNTLQKLNMVHTFIRDVILVFLILFLDIAILIVFKRIMLRKKLVMSDSIKKESRTSSSKS